MRVFLSDCMYGMDLYKKEFLSEHVQRTCICNIINIFINAHSVGNVVGPIDIRKMQIDLENGEVEIRCNESVYAMRNCVDTLKYMPPEVILGNGDWTVFSDLYLLALLLFSVMYFAFPFDGLMTYEKPIMSIEHAKRIYGNPVFAFDSCNMNNRMLGYNSNKAIELWNKSTPEVKDYFVVNFTKGIKAFDMRTTVINTLRIFDSKTISEYSCFLVINGKKIGLYEGLEIYAKDINSNCKTNDKLLKVIKSTKNENMLALQNASSDTWSVYLPDGHEIMVLPKSVAPIIQGAIISIEEFLANII